MDFAIEHLQKQINDLSIKKTELLVNIHSIEESIKILNGLIEVIKEKKSKEEE